MVHDLDLDGIAPVVACIFAANTIVVGAIFASAHERRGIGPLVQDFSISEIRVFRFFEDKTTGVLVDPMQLIVAG